MKMNRHVGAGQQITLPSKTSPMQYSVRQFGQRTVIRLTAYSSLLHLPESGRQAERREFRSDALGAPASTALPSLSLAAV
jgi:hypothetical protein